MTGKTMTPPILTPTGEEGLRLEIRQECLEGAKLVKRLIETGKVKDTELAWKVLENYQKLYKQYQ